MNYFLGIRDPGQRAGRGLRGGRGSARLRAQPPGRRQRRRSRPAPGTTPPPPTTATAGALPDGNLERELVVGEPAQSAQHPARRARHRAHLDGRPVRVLRRCDRRGARLERRAHAGRRSWPTINSQIIAAADRAGGPLGPERGHGHDRRTARPGPRSPAPSPASTARGCDRGAPFNIPPPTASDADPTALAARRTTTRRCGSTGPTTPRNELGVRDRALDHRRRAAPSRRS